MPRKSLYLHGLWLRRTAHVPRGHCCLFIDSYLLNISPKRNALVSQGARINRQNSFKNGWSADVVWVNIVLVFKSDIQRMIINSMRLCLFLWLKNFCMFTSFTNFLKIWSRTEPILIHVPLQCTCKSSKGRIARTCSLEIVNTET